MLQKFLTIVKRNVGCQNCRISEASRFCLNNFCSYGSEPNLRLCPGGVVKPLHRCNIGLAVFPEFAISLGDSVQGSRDAHCARLRSADVARSRAPYCPKGQLPPSVQLFGRVLQVSLPGDRITSYSHFYD